MRIGAKLSLGYVLAIAALTVLGIGIGACASSEPSEPRPEAVVQPNLAPEDIAPPVFPCVGDAECGANKRCCQGVCKSILTDDNNCGVCGKQCFIGDCCNGTCKSSDDPKNCGGCGNVCKSGDCVEGRC